MNSYAAVLEYIEDYWDKCLVRPRGNAVGSPRGLILQLGRIKLPNAVVSPNHNYFAGSQYYWDTYFTIIGLIDSGRADIAKGMVDNLCWLMPKFGLIPARNSFTSIGRTQPPFLTSMAREVYDAGAADDDWMNNVMASARTEYEKVWSNKQRLDPVTGLNRYQPRAFRRLLTVYESGWDVSTRFAHGRTTLLPIDLNALLYKYETDMATWACHTGDQAAEELWSGRAERRKAAVNTYLWDEKQGVFLDYDTADAKRDPLRTIATFYALWSGLASPEQAERCRTQLKIFEQEWGLANTEMLPWRHRQWDYPNGWPPQQLLVFEGFKRYGFNEDAKRIGNKYLELNKRLLNDTGSLWEKYDVVRGEIGRAGRYPTQPGFAWTNGVFLRIHKAIDGL